MNESRVETCHDCYETRDREWVTRTIRSGISVPKGWRVEPSTGGNGWRKISAPTRWVSLCGCDSV